MSEARPPGLYIYQPFGTDGNKNLDRPDGLFAIGGLCSGVTMSGFTRDEAEAVLDSLNGISWLSVACAECGCRMRLESDHCATCGARIPAPFVESSPPERAP